MKFTTNIFIKKAKEIHGSKYDYSLVEYVNSHVKIKVRCIKHNIFFYPQPYNHLNGSGCIKCGYEKNGRKILSGDVYLDRIKKCQGNKFDYSLFKYLGSIKNVILICNNCSNQIQKKAYQLLKEFNCPHCSLRKNSINNIEFKKRGIEKHNDKYDYDLVECNGVFNKVKIICKKHGIFKQSIKSHLRGEGCPNCRESKGEKRIVRFLDKNKINFIREKKFNNCYGDKMKLSFDFYIDNKNMLIEYDGEQHFKPIKIFGGVKKYEKRKLYDEIKNNYAKNKKIKLIRIPYYSYDKIDDILSEFFN